MVAGSVRGDRRSEAFFADFRLWINDEIARLALELLPPEYGSEQDFMTRVGHRNVARLGAEEIVLRDSRLVPEVDEDDELLEDWAAMLGAGVIDVEDVVLPRYTELIAATTAERSRS